MSENKSICRVCDRPAYCKGYCTSHYYRLWRHGDPLAGRTPPGEPRAFIERLLEEKPTGCVIWPFATATGYAQILWNGKYVVVSRLICRMVHGDPPDSAMEAAHRCGNGARGCVSPKCIYWATKAENEADKLRHGTIASGEKNGNSKLTDLQAEAIRNDPRKTATIAAEHGVSSTHIRRIKTGKCRSTVTRPV